MNVVKIKLDNIPVKLLLSRFRSVKNAIKHLEKEANIFVMNVDKHVLIVNTDDVDYAILFYTVNPGTVSKISNIHKTISSTIWKMFQQYAEIIFQHYALSHTSVYSEPEYETFLKSKL